MAPQRFHGGEETTTCRFARSDESLSAPEGFSRSHLWGGLNAWRAGSRAVSFQSLGWAAAGKSSGRSIALLPSLTNDAGGRVRQAAPGEGRRGPITSTDNWRTSSRRAWSHQPLAFLQGNSTVLRGCRYRPNHYMWKSQSPAFGNRGLRSRAEHRGSEVSLSSLASFESPARTGLSLCGCINDAG